VDLFIKTHLLRSFLSRGPATARELTTALDTSQPSLSRLMSQLGTGVQRIGAARTTRYALKRDIRGLGAEFPLYQVSEGGQPHFLGTLVAVEPRGTVLLFNDSERPAEYFVEFPFWLEDARPSGFLGRLIAKRLPTSGYPENVVQWTNTDTLHYWASHGADLIGNTIVGSTAFRLWNERETRGETRAAITFERYVAEVLSHGAAGSSAGGEQPKFLATVDMAPAIVKFSPPLSSEIGRRRAELLVCEHLALKTLSNRGIQATESSITFGEQRVFLELRRFDRTGEAGRRAVISLRALDNEFTGVVGTWRDIAKALLRRRRITPEIYEFVMRLYYFGLLIGNSDMHAGNISFFCDNRDAAGRPTSVAPVYDMLPMNCAPANESVLPLRFSFPVLDPQDKEHILASASIAKDFWQAVSRDEWIGAEWHGYSAKWLQRIEGVLK
jgi:hypothetical protein